jgi:hypothetical protein
MMVICKITTFKLPGSGFQKPAQPVDHGRSLAGGGITATATRLGAGGAGGGESVDGGFFG